MIFGTSGMCLILKVTPVLRSTTVMIIRFAEPIYKRRSKTADDRPSTVDRGLSIVYRPLSIVCASSASNNPLTCEHQTASPASDIRPRSDSTLRPAQCAARATTPANSCCRSSDFIGNHSRFHRASDCTVYFFCTREKPFFGIIFFA